MPKSRRLLRAPEPMRSSGGRLRLGPLVALMSATSLVAVGLVAAVPGSASGVPESQGAPDCSALGDPVYQVVKPNNDVALATVWSREADRAEAHGFTEDLGEVFQAAIAPAAGLVPVHRLYRSVGQDFLYTADPDEVQARTESIVGYEDQGRSFYASPVADPCLTPVYRYKKDGRHRLAALQQDRDALIADGWSAEGVSFYAALPSGAEPDPAPEPDPSPTPGPTPTATVTPPPTTPAGDTTFSFAAMPDTQQEVLNSKDARFLNRTQWLAKQKDVLDLRFVTHSGDVHNWDNPTHDQYEISSTAMKALETADIPYTLAIGNHDTMATGPGGGARDPKLTRAYQRDTDTFNAYYDASRYGVVSGAFEKGKVDNVYALHQAGGLKWMVLVLELWPRQEVVDWAKQAVVAHPDHNVILVTHEFVNGGGGLQQSGRYGDLSAQAVFDQLVSKYPNIKMVLSGHTGYAGNYVLTGAGGNKVYSFLSTIHSGVTNPVRLFTVDTQAGTIKTWIYAPYTNQTYTSFTHTVTGVDWVR